MNSLCLVLLSMCALLGLSYANYYGGYYPAYGGGSSSGGYGGFLGLFCK